MTVRRGLLLGLRAGRRSMRILPQIIALVAVLAIGAFPHPYPPVPAFFLMPCRTEAGARALSCAARDVC